MKTSSSIFTSYRSLIAIFSVLLLPVKGDEVPVAKTLPKDFAFQSSSGTVGVVPASKQYVTIRRIEGLEDKVAYAITKGEELTPRIEIKDAGKEEEAGFQSAKNLSEAQVLEIYKQAIELGFFDLNETYPEEFPIGGSITKIIITANGVTKKVSVAGGTNVEAINKLMAAVRGL